MAISTALGVGQMKVGDLVKYHDPKVFGNHLGVILEQCKEYGDYLILFSNGERSRRWWCPPKNVELVK